LRTNGKSEKGPTIIIIIITAIIIIIITIITEIIIITAIIIIIIILINAHAYLECLNSLRIIPGIVCCAVCVSVQS
jgi:hypothetical protein